MAAKEKPLTSKQEAFVRAWVAGGDDGEALSISDAYRKSYNIGESTTAGSVNTMASRLAQRVEIRRMRDKLLAAKRQGSVLSALSRQDKTLKFFEQVMDGELETTALALRAGENLARASGLFSTDIKLTTESKTSGSLTAELEALLLAANDATESPANESTESVTNDNEQLH